MSSYDLLFLYGSQTGTAQDAAEGLSRKVRRRGLKTAVLGLDKYDVQNLPSEVRPIMRWAAVCWSLTAFSFALPFHAGHPPLAPVSLLSPSPSHRPM